MVAGSFSKLFFHILMSVLTTQMSAAKIAKIIQALMYVLVTRAINSMGPLSVSISTNVIQVPAVKMPIVMILMEASLVLAEMDLEAMDLFAKVRHCQKINYLIIYACSTLITKKMLHATMVSIGYS